MNPTQAGAELKRALRACFAGLGAAIVFETVSSRPWASITSSGERHHLSLCLPGPGAQAAVDVFIDGLEEHDFDLRGQILADIEVAGIARDADGQIRLTLEALTVKD